MKDLQEKAINSARGVYSVIVGIVLTKSLQIRCLLFGFVKRCRIGKLL